jgi:hypothetical protein
MTRRMRLWIGVTSGTVTWLSLLYVTVFAWDDFVEATGDTTVECDRGRCGALGEFTDDHPFILLLLFLVGTAVPAAAIGWWVSRLLRRWNGQPANDAAPTTP